MIHGSCRFLGLQQSESTGKAYFHVSHDFWLIGPGLQYLSWLMYIKLLSQTAVSNEIGVKSLVQEIEQAATNEGIVSPTFVIPGAKASIDAVMINLHYEDHLHQPMLLTFALESPCSLPAKALQSSRNSTTSTQSSPIKFPSRTPSLVVSKIQILGTPYPLYLTFFCIYGHHGLNFLTRLIWSPTQHNNETILHSPHGLHTLKPAL